MSEPTKKDVLEIAEYLGCNGEELWIEVSKLLTKQHYYAIEEYVRNIEKADTPTEEDIAKEITEMRRKKRTWHKESTNE